VAICSLRATVLSLLALASPNVAAIVRAEAIGPAVAGRPARSTSEETGLPRSCSAGECLSESVTEARASTPRHLGTNPPFAHQRPGGRQARLVVSRSIVATAIWLLEHIAVRQPEESHKMTGGPVPVCANPMAKSWWPSSAVAGGTPIRSTQAARSRYLGPFAGSLWHGGLPRVLWHHRDSNCDSDRPRLRCWRSTIAPPTVVENTPRELCAAEHPMLVEGGPRGENVAH